jgi:hypothetical protein
MRVSNGVCALLALCLLAFASCKKSNQGVAPNTDYSGVKVDWPKLDTEFATSDSELQADARLAKRHIRYSQFMEALMDLDKLSRNPGLSGSQKKVVADLIEQTKQVIAKTTPAQ